MDVKREAIRDVRAVGRACHRIDQYDPIIGLCIWMNEDECEEFGLPYDTKDAFLFLADGALEPVVVRRRDLRL